MNKSNVYQKKEKEVLLILNRLNEWNKTDDSNMEEAYRIIKENQESMARIESLDSELSESESKEFSKKHQTYMEAVIIKQKQLIEKIKQQSKHLEEQLGQMANQSKAVKGYMAKEKSLFIDKDM